MVNYTATKITHFNICYAARILVGCYSDCRADGTRFSTGRQLESITKPRLSTGSEFCIFNRFSRGQYLVWWVRVRVRVRVRLGVRVRVRVRVSNLLGSR